MRMHLYWSLLTWWANHVTYKCISSVFLTFVLNTCAVLLYLFCVQFISLYIHDICWCFVYDCVHVLPICSQDRNRLFGSVCMYAYKICIFISFSKRWALLISYVHMNKSAWIEDTFCIWDRVVFLALNSCIGNRPMTHRKSEADVCNIGGCHRTTKSPSHGRANL